MGKKNKNKKANNPTQELSQQINQEAEGDQLKSFQEGILKFGDSIIASTSAASEEIQVWEPKTLAPYEPMVDNKFLAGANTLCVNSE